MAFQAIRQNLEDNDNNFLGHLPILPVPSIPALAGLWEWNVLTGIPFDPNNGWRRHCPMPTRMSAFFNDPVARYFRRQMRGPRRSFTIDLDRGYQRRKHAKTLILAYILKCDFKKIRVQRSSRPGRLVVIKNNDPLIPFDNNYGQVGLRIVANGVRKTIQELINEINLNATRGFHGPGSFRCRDPGCTVTGPCLTQSPVVQWGPLPHQVLHLQKRFTCKAVDVVYLQHCAACLARGNWTTYVGESEYEAGNIHDRWNQGAQITDQQNRERYPMDANLTTTVVRMLNGEIPDPHGLLRDPFTHYNYVHTPTDRRYTIVNGNFATKSERRRHERFYMLMCGNGQYNTATNSGSLNH